MDKLLISFLVLSGFAVVATAGAQTADSDHAALINFVNVNGLQSRTIDGKNVYCRTTKPLGSNFSRTQCITEAAIAAYVHEHKG